MLLDAKSSIPATRLPLLHPDYRYAASRNIYSAKLETLKGRVFSCNETETHRGHWREYFPDQSGTAIARRQLHVEIGCNAGHVTVEWAASNPHQAYIGIDWKFKPIFRATEKGMKKSLGNLLFFRAHADRLHFMFGEGEIDHLYLFFPDPWAKKSQLKNRFITAERLRAIAPLMSAGGKFHIRTDHPGYFEWMEAAVAEVPDLWRVSEHTRDRHAGNAAPEKLKIPDVTLFEGLFIKDGIKINAMTLERV